MRQHGRAPVRPGWHPRRQVGALLLVRASTTRRYGPPAARPTSPSRTRALDAWSPSRWPMLSPASSSFGRGSERSSRPRISSTPRGSALARSRTRGPEASLSSCLTAPAHGGGPCSVRAHHNAIGPANSGRHWHAMPLRRRSPGGASRGREIRRVFVGSRREPGPGGVLVAESVLSPVG